ncbi:MAG: alpha/beta hydrolase, partial [Actinomycetia bacterium]|nr:alpha/beta hydrolase [Actinomycetes bacterium]
MSLARPPRRTLRAAVVGVTALLMTYAPLASAEPGGDPLGPSPSIEQSPEEQDDAPDIEPTAGTVTTVPEPDGTEVELDIDIYVPPTGEGPFPAVILAHGFGGSKSQLRPQAARYADAGYLVLAYSARGFGASGGQIHLMDPGLEAADVSTLVDLLAERPDVRLDSDGDPRVGIAGASYGGAAALMGSALDPRIDAAVAAITWHDLGQSLFAQSASTDQAPGTPAELVPIDTPGVYKQLWGSRFFASALAAGATPGGNPLCGRFEATLCAGLTQAAETGQPDPDLLATLSAHSPGAVIGEQMPPTLLVQGMADTLFGIDQADANAQLIANTGAPLA